MADVSPLAAAADCRFFNVRGTRENAPERSRGGATLAMQLLRRCEARADDGKVRRSMVQVEERVASVVARVREQGKMIEKIDDRFDRFEERMDERFNALEAKMDRRFADVDKKFDKVDERMARMETKMDRQFMWVVGIQMTMFIAMVATLMGVVAAPR
jgi:nucleoside-diphosphate-sugar epimerase